MKLDWTQENFDFTRYVSKLINRRSVWEIKPLTVTPNLLVFEAEGVGRKTKPEVHMKTKENFDQKPLSLENLTPKSRPKSFRPMRSMVSIRSLKPRTNVVSFTNNEVSSETTKSN